MSEGPVGWTSRAPTECIIRYEAALQRGEAETGTFVGTRLGEVPDKR